MKKTILILAAILVVVYLALSLLGAGGEYPAERLLYRAMKTHAKIADNPDVAPPWLIASVQGGLKKLIAKYPKTFASKNAYIKLAEFQIFTKEYDDAFATIDDIMNKFGNDQLIMSMAYFFRGNIYEKQGNWQKALKEFEVLKNKYANTELGIGTPLYIARYYRKKGESAEAANAYGEAARFYERTGAENRGKALGYVASSLLLGAYMETGNYEKAGEALAALFDNYPSPVTYSKFLAYVEQVYVEKLGKQEKAIEIYKNIQNKTKDQKFKQFLEKRIDYLKAKN